MDRQKKIEEILRLLETPALKVISPEEMRAMFKEAIRPPTASEEELPAVKSLSDKKDCEVLDFGLLLELVRTRVKMH